MFAAEAYPMSRWGSPMSYFRLPPRRLSNARQKASLAPKRAYQPAHRGRTKIQDGFQQSAPHFLGTGCSSKAVMRVQRCAARSRIPRSEGGSRRVAARRGRLPLTCGLRALYTTTSAPAPARSQRGAGKQAGCTCFPTLVQPTLGAGLCPNDRSRVLRGRMRFRTTPYGGFGPTGVLPP